MKLKGIRKDSIRTFSLMTLTYFVKMFKNSCSNFKLFIAVLKKKQLFLHQQLVFGTENSKTAVQTVNSKTVFVF